MDGLVERVVRSKAMLERLSEATAARNRVDEPNLIPEVILLQLVEMVQRHLSEHVAVPTVIHVGQVIAKFLDAFMFSLCHPACWKRAIDFHHEARKVDQNRRPQLISICVCFFVFVLSVFQAAA